MAKRKILNDMYECEPPAHRINVIRKFTAEYYREYIKNHGLTHFKIFDKQYNGSSYWNPSTHRYTHCVYTDGEGALLLREEGWKIKNLKVKFKYYKTEKPGTEPNVKLMIKTPRRKMRTYARVAEGQTTQG